MLSRFCLEKYNNNNNMFTHCGTVLRRRSFCSKSNKTKKKSWLCYDLLNTLRFIQAVNGAYVNDKKKITISRTGNDVPAITRFELLFHNI